MNRIVLLVATSRIASLLLPGGWTAHSLFKIPLQLNESSCCAISKQTNLTELIRNAYLIIWDEAPMMHKNAFDAVDRTLCDILTTINPAAGEKLFGGITVAFWGDFWQILPVIKKENRDDTVASSITKSQI